jgi:phosphoribosylformimino-5-aminoimidazole carboxamide ribotide isomerase
MEIIPAIDIINGKCVRLTKGDFNQQKIYNENPLEVAKLFEDAGITRLHLVDLDGAKAGAIQNIKVLETLTANTKLKIDFGGGVKTKADVIKILNTGAAYVTIGSLAVKQPLLFQEFIDEFGVDNFFIGADTLDNQIKINGWLQDGGLSIKAFIKFLTEKKINYIFCTDISKDGMQQGPSVELYQQLIENFTTIQLVASGGVRKINDLLQLKKIGCKGAIVGKAFYEGTLKLSELSKL